MTAYKNFTQAMTDRGIELNVHETRRGYSRREDGTIRASCVKMSSNSSVIEQFFSEDDSEYVIEIKMTEQAVASVELAIANKLTHVIFRGGEFAETKKVMKRVKNVNGRGYFNIPTIETKVIDGVVEVGEYVPVSIQSTSKDVYRITHKRV